MSFSPRAVVVIATLSLGALTAQILRTYAQDVPEPAPPQVEDRGADSEATSRAPSSEWQPDAAEPHLNSREQRGADATPALLFKKLGKSTTVEFLDLPLEECLNHLQESHGIQIWTDTATLADEGIALDQPLTLKLTGVRLESILNLLLRPCQLEWIIQDEVLKITTATWSFEHPQVAAYEVQNLLDAGHLSKDLIESIKTCIQPLSWKEEFQAGIALSGGVLIIRQSQQVHGEIGRLLADLDEIAFDQEEETHARGRKNALVAQVSHRAHRPGTLRTIAAPWHSVAFREKKDDFEKKDKPQRVPAEEKIIKAFDLPTTVEFNDLPLEDCLTYLEKFHSLNLYLDKQSLSDEGVSLDQPISLKLANVSFESTLHLLLQPLNLDWVVEDEVLKITTESWIKAHPEVRTYEIENLIDAGHTVDALMTSIRRCIDPPSWNGEYAAISHTGGVLVIRQSQRIHSEIERLLADLDNIVLDVIAEAAQDARHGKEISKEVVSVRIYQTDMQPAAQIAECIEQFVARDTWREHGGEGRILAMNGQIVVEQSAAVHREIQRFLELLLHQPQ